MYVKLGGVTKDNGAFAQIPPVLFDEGLGVGLGEGLGFGVGEGDCEVPPVPFPELAEMALVPTELVADVFRPFPVQFKYNKPRTAIENTALIFFVMKSPTPQIFIGANSGPQ